MDFIFYLFFDYSTNPLELAVRFLVMVLVFDAIFGLLETLIGASRK